MSTTRLIAFDPATTINASDVLYIAQGNAEKKLTFSALAAAVAAAYPPGQGAYTTTTADFMQPIALANVTVQVVTTAWMAATEPVLIPGGGYYRVVSITDSTHAVLENLGFTGNAAPTTTITAGSKVSATGERGQAGATGATGATGPEGPTGPAATISIGTVTTLSAGSAATVTNVGTSGAAVFNFGIPKGTDGTGTGTVTSVSVASANGFGGSVANASTTPAITLTTSVTSGKLVKASSGALAAAVAGTDYAAATPGTSTQLLASDGAGGFAAVTVGSNLTLSGGTLSAAAGTGGGAWTKIQTKIASSSSYLDFTGLTGYTKYALVFENLVPASSGSYLIALAGYGSSPIYVTSGYSNSYGYVTSSGSTGGVTSAATTGAIVGGGQGGLLTSAPGTSGQIVAFLGSSAAVQFMGESVAGTSERAYFLSFVSLGAACTAIKLQVASGALITSGTATLYGIN